MPRIIICSGGQAEIAGAPDTIRLLRLGHIESTHGPFNVDEESFRLMRQQFLRRGNDIVIDYEHQTLQDVQAPAGGWIKDLMLEGGAICAKVEWTPKAREYLENKEYRYISPTVLVRNSDKKAVVLHSAALTNIPAINGMYPVINSVDLSDYEKGENSMDLLKQLAALLGLGEDASEEQVVEALKACLNERKDLKDAAQQQTQETEGKIVANKVVCELLGLKAGAATDEVSAAIVALKSAAPEGGVSAVDFQALKDKLAQRDAQDAVAVALKAGKLSTAMREWGLTYALKDPDGFASFVEKAPQVVPMGELLPNKDDPRDARPTETTLNICKQLGVSDADLKLYGKDGD